MKLPASKIPSFVSNPDLNCKFILIYGSDSGLVENYYKKIAEKFLEDLQDPFRFTNFDYQKIKDDPSLFLDEILSQSMVGGQKLIKIDNLSTTLNKEFIEIIENNNPDSISIFTAGELSTSSSLRKFFEKSKKTIILPCYKDDEYSIASIIKQKFTSNNIKFSDDIIKYLQSCLFGNRSIIENEIDKIILYIGNKKNIEINDIEKIVKNSKEFSLDKIINNFASRNLEKLSIELDESFKENIQPIVIIRSLINYFCKLKQVKELIEGGKDAQSAISTLKPPMFFKQLPIFKSHLANWNIENIDEIIKQMFQLEIDCKSTNKPAELVCKRTLLMLPIYLKN